MTHRTAISVAAADPSNPQSWNRYAYVLNNPLAYSDPLGFGPQCHQDIPLACPTAFGGGGPDSNLPGDIFSSWNEFEVLGFAYTPGGTVTVLTEQNGEPVFVQAPTYPNIGALSLLPQFPSSSGLASWGLFAANNGRNCTTGGASRLQYAGATAQVAAMTGEFFSGFGPGNLTFGPNSATSQVMAQSGPVQEVLNEYYMTGAPNGLYSFGLPGLVSAGGNPVAQFVGSFRWSVTPTDGGINLSLTNTTSFRSLTYDAGPQWQRGSWPTPMGNTHQTFNITATCK